MKEAVNENKDNANLIQNLPNLLSHSILSIGSKYSYTDSPDIIVKPLSSHKDSLLLIPTFTSDSYYQIVVNRFREVTQEELQEQLIENILRNSKNFISQGNSWTNLKLPVLFNQDSEVQTYFYSGKPSTNQLESESGKRVAYPVSMTKPSEFELAGEQPSKNVIHKVRNGSNYKLSFSYTSAVYSANQTILNRFENSTPFQLGEYAKCTSLSTDLLEYLQIHGGSEVRASLNQNPSVEQPDQVSLPRQSSAKSFSQSRELDFEEESQIEEEAARAL
jgi:hypothetical protein